MARRSLAESIAIIRLLQIEGQFTAEAYPRLYSKAEEIFKMLNSAIRSLTL